MIGLIAYATVPNLHEVATKSQQTVTGPVNIPVGPNSESETAENVTIVPGRTNELVVNLTVSLSNRTPSTVEFKFFAASELGSCMKQTNPSGCLVDTNVTNQTIRVPLNPSTTSPNGPTTYYFGFANKDSSSKTVTVSASLSTSSVQTLAARDGSLNFAALGLSVFGLLVAVYGVAARTVIQWE
jgi:hypothetical protein